MNPVAPLQAALAAQAATAPTSVTSRWVRDGRQVLRDAAGTTGSSADERSLLSVIPTQVR